MSLAPLTTPAPIDANPLLEPWTGPFEAPPFDRFEPQQFRPAFDAVVSSAMRLRNSVAVEIGLLVLVFVAGRYVWQSALALHSDTWYATAASDGPHHTPAGYW